MSMGGLLAQAFLGGSAEVGKGIGNRIREEAKLKRQQALEGTRTTETMKQQAHASSLKRGENEQRQTMEMEQIGARDENARGRINLTDEVGRRNYEDVTDENGNIIGQRQTESNKFSPFATDSSSSAYNGLSKEDWTRLKYVHGVKNERLEKLREMSRDPAIVMDQKQTDEMLALNREVSSLESVVFGQGNTSKSALEKLLEGDSQAPAGDGDTPGPKEKPKGLLQQANERADTRSRQEQTEQIKSDAGAMLDEGAQLVSRLNQKVTRDLPSGGRPGVPMEKSPEDMAAAQALVQKMIALDSDPNTSEVITPRQRENMIQLINELKRAGVPVTPQ